MTEPPNTERRFRNADFGQYNTEVHVSGEPPNTEALLATVRHETNLIRTAVGMALAEKNIPREPQWTQLTPASLNRIDAALDVIASELERRDKVKEEAWTAYKRATDAAHAAEAEIERMRNFNAATRAAYETLNPSGVSSDPSGVGGAGPGPSGPTIAARLDRAVEALRGIGVIGDPVEGTGFSPRAQEIARAALAEIEERSGE